MKHRQKIRSPITFGFTLIEFLVTSIIFVLLGLMTLPSFTLYTRLQEEKTFNFFKQALLYAKMHAVRSGQSTLICPSHDQRSCSPDWSSPYIIALIDHVSDKPTVFWQQSLAVLPIKSSHQSPFIRFNSQGWCLTPQTIRYQGTHQRQTLVISFSGRIRCFTEKI